MQRRSLVAGATGLAASLALPAAVRAQGAYPNKAIKMIVPHSPGTSPDVVARLMADRLGQALGQPVVVDNRAGAGGMMGAEQGAQQPADGYNLMFTVKGVVAIGPHLYTNSKYNPPKDYRGISEILIVPHIITANNNTPYNTLGEMVEFAKKNPGVINYASTGVGSQPHVALETWARRLGIKMTHVPYKANPSPDVMSGVVNIYLEAATVSQPSVKAGRIKALAVSGTERLPGLPDLPTVSEYKADLDPNGVIGNSWHGLFTPTGTPDAIVNRLNTELVKIVKTDEMQTRLRGLGLTPTGTTSAALTAKLDADYTYWGKLIKELDIKVE